MSRVARPDDQFFSLDATFSPRHTVSGGYFSLGDAARVTCGAAERCQSGSTRGRKLGCFCYSDKLKIRVPTSNALPIRYFANVAHLEEVDGERYQKGAALAKFGLSTRLAGVGNGILLVDKLQVRQGRVVSCCSPL